MKIVKSAIKYKDEIFTGYGHEECFVELFKKYKRDDINSQDIKEGFVTDSGEFIDRVSATLLSQLEDKPYTRLMLGTDPLTSEDLYVYWLHEKDNKIADMEQEQIAIMKEHEEFMKQAQQQVEQLEKENEFLKKQNSLMYQQGLEQGKFDKQMEQEYGKS